MLLKSLDKTAFKFKWLPSLCGIEFDKRKDDEKKKKKKKKWKRNMPKPEPEMRTKNMNFNSLNHYP